MTSQPLSEDAMRALIRAVATTHRNHATFAASVGVGKGQVSKILQGYAAPGGKVIASLGYRCITKNQKHVTNHLYERVGP